jgi:hypothetical protein
MTIKLGDFFPKKTIDEPFLSLDDPKWNKLEGGYKGALYDASVPLKQLEQAKTLAEVDAIYHELWNELHHQGDVGLASYYAVPHLVRIANQTQLINYNVLDLVSTIEIQRHKNNPKLPGKFLTSYNNAIEELHDLAQIVLKRSNSFYSVVTALSAIALSKGHRNLADAILKFDGEDQIEDFLKNY